MIRFSRRNALWLLLGLLSLAVWACGPAEVTVEKPVTRLVTQETEHVETVVVTVEKPVIVTEQATVPLPSVGASLACLRPVRAIPLQQPTPQPKPKTARDARVMPTGPGPSSQPTRSLNHARPAPRPVLTHQRLAAHAKAPPGPERVTVDRHLVRVELD